MRVDNVILKPIVTEKSVELGEDDKYVFKVNKKASKGAIKQRVEELFGVDVLEVNTMVMPGKKRRIIGTRKFTKTPSWKKAIVKLREGQTIDLFPEE
jgi:large subunit ribosomal protein L23